MSRRDLATAIGFEPIFPAERGSIVTQAFRLCCACEGVISATGGPGRAPLCINCTKELIAGITGLNL